MGNIIDLNEFKKMFEEYKKTNKELITIKTTVIDDILKILEENTKKNIVLLSKTYKLIVALKNKGVSQEEIEKILSLKK